MRDIRNFDHVNNELLVPWGQFLTHDISFYPDDIRNATTPGSNSLIKIIIFINKWKALFNTAITLKFIKKQFFL